MGLLEKIVGAVLKSSAGTTTTSKTKRTRKSSQAQDPLSSILGSLKNMDPAVAQTLISAVLAMLQSKGGLAGLLKMLKGSGLQDIADSWVGTGRNAKISTNQLEGIFGSSVLSELAGQLGMPTKQVGSSLTKILPELVNQATPQGRVPESDPFTELMKLLK